MDAKLYRQATVTHVCFALSVARVQGCGQVTMSGRLPVTIKALSADVVDRRKLDGARAPACSVNVPSVLIEAVDVDGFGGGGVVAPSFGDVQVADVFDGRDDGGADGGQVGGAAAGAACRGVFGECHVADVVVCLDGPVLADQAGQVLCGGAGAGQAGDGVDGFAWRSCQCNVLPPAGDLDGLAGAGEVQVVDVGGLEGAGPGAAVPGAAGGAAGRYLPQGRALTRAYSSGWLRFTTAM